MRPDQHLPTALLMEELGMKQAELKIVGQIASTLSYNLMCSKLAYFSGSTTEAFSRYFTKLDMQDVVEAALADSPALEELKERIQAVEYELNERECDVQDEVAA
jgi:hypothetical protein